MKRFLPWLPSLLVLLMLVNMLLPWARTGVGIDASEVLGSEIPVINWSAFLTLAVALAASAAAALFPSRWLWLLANGVAGLVTTSSAVVLGTLDVIDGSVARNVVKALPQDLEDVTPRLQPALGIYLMFVLAVAFFGVTFWATFRLCRSRVTSEGRSIPDHPTGAVPLGEPPEHELEWK